MKKPYLVLRKVYKPYMGVALSAETTSITTGAPQMLYLDEKDHRLITGKRVILFMWHYGAERPFKYYEK